MLLAVVLSCSGSEPVVDQVAEVAPPPAVIEEIVPVAVTYADRLHAADARVDAGQGVAAAADALVVRYALSGDVGDLTEALELFGKARIASGGARLEALLGVRDIGAAAASLATEGTASQKARGAMLSGRYPDAAQVLAAEAGADLATLRARAQLQRAVGQLKRADDLLAEAGRLEGLAPEQLASLAADRAELDLDRGDGWSALEDLVKVDALMAGWWRADELRGRALLNTDQADEAVEALEGWTGLASRPELLDVAARAIAAAGLPAKADAWSGNALAAHEARFDLAPAAAAGPLIRHWLEFGDGDVEALVGLAEEQAKVTPDAETLRLLCEARLLGGDPAGAVEAAEAALGTRARSVILHQTAAEAYAAAGDGAKAQEQRAAALALSRG